MRNQVRHDVRGHVGYFVWERGQMRNQLGRFVVTRRFGAEPFGRLRVMTSVGTWVFFDGNAVRCGTRWEFAS